MNKQEKLLEILKEKNMMPVLKEEAQLLFRKKDYDGNYSIIAFITTWVDSSNPFNTKNTRYRTIGTVNIWTGIVEYTYRPKEENIFVESVVAEEVIDFEGVIGQRLEEDGYIEWIDKKGNKQRRKTYKNVDVFGKIKKPIIVRKIKTKGKGA